MSVRVVVPAIGGGYGGKGHPTIEPIAAVLSSMTGRRCGFSCDGKRSSSR